tara:strand:+ start:497 stop:613 length:117 start_codon:yes stop_codon:yes gene_type:complete
MIKNGITKDKAKEIKSKFVLTKTEKLSTEIKLPTKMLF